VHIELCEERSGLPFDRQTWNQLLAQCDVNTVFQSYEWFDAWSRVQPPDQKLFFLVLRDAEGWVGFAPLMIARGPRGKRELQFAASTNADYLDFVLARRHDDAFALIGDFLRRHRHRWDVMYLRNLPLGSRSVTRLQASFERAGLHPVIESTISCPALVIRGREDEVRRLINKYSLRRKVAGLEKRGKVVFHACCTREETEQNLEAFFDQHVGRWEGTASPSLFLRPEQREFFRQLVKTFSQTGELCFSRLDLDGRSIAYHLGFRRHGKLIWYKPSFDRAFAELSPGLVLIQALIGHALESGCEELDFTIGEEPFKERFTNLRRANANVRVFSTTPRYIVGLIAQGLRRVRRTGLRLLPTRPH